MTLEIQHKNYKNCGQLSSGCTPQSLMSKMLQYISATKKKTSLKNSIDDYLLCDFFGSD